MADQDADLDLDVDDAEEITTMGEPAMCGVTSSTFTCGVTPRS